ncbi:YifB family Mg chelatase-like AAA ATPase [Fodinisporobacter ferrooxydans]|uniref:YifB family Mg chelatase-like AAA ATPase n=1 Tax=Fodinisporobacter ferrooxydans TaxID=2901836 RepID=A0ABY4CFN8_9BACL|nr:YifB family Mg chelatase-like AAA ATPase [Alicyclobacillaceae bacterium MYW30-H2]
MFTQTLGITLDGVDGLLVNVEVDVHPGLPMFSIVGLPDSSVRESKDRVRAAILNSGYDFPMQRITVNLAPADNKKEGSCLDLAIAIGILVATGQIPQQTEQMAIIGELSLDGTTRKTHGSLPQTIAAIQAGIRKLAISTDSIVELEMFQTYLDTIELVPVTSLAELANHMSGKQQIKINSRVLEPLKDDDIPIKMDLQDVRGQVLAKRALEISAAGGHNLLLIGPPGCGKSMIANRIRGILPKLTNQEALHVNQLYSVALPQIRSQRMLRERPFRAPHHSISIAGLVGGGVPPQPGEITLAHHGVLFLDELPEFPKSTLDHLRQPLENGTITISRARYQYTLPSMFQLLAAMNPCPCGFYQSANLCRCSLQQIKRYQSRISGPLLDRFHMYIWMTPELGTTGQLDSPIDSSSSGESSATVRKRVEQAFEIQTKRNSDGFTNAMTGPESLSDWPIAANALDLWEQTTILRKLSARSREQVIRVARTIADLAERNTIEMKDVAESLQYTDSASLPLLYV